MRLILAALVAVAAALCPLAAAQTTCSLQLGNAPAITFDRCLTIDGIGDNFVVYWTQNASNTVWGLSTASSSGYVSLGFPSEPEEMVGATAFSLQSCSSCATGAELREWYLGGTSTGDIQLQNSAGLATAASTTPSGGMAAVFTAGPSQGSVPLIFAAGGVYNDGSMRQHGQYGSGTLDLSTGTLSDPEVDSKPVSALIAAHLWLLLLGWGVFIPLGIVIARTMKERDPLWFHLHRAIQCLGLLMGLIGFGLGFAIAGGWNGRFPVHRNLGMAATIFGLVQLPALRWRPKLTSPHRRLFNLCHWYIGRVAVILAVANIFYGMIAVLAVSSGAWAAYTAVLGVIVGLAVLKESYEYCKLPPPGAAVDWKENGLAEAHNGAHNGTAVGNGLATSQAQEVGLVGLDGKSN
ncbi:hypothetical protein COHA_006192 [Chlorella ohadii]|uniref:Cytochrome b561 domain-containing protein n=1 Tax=Chlorella ohadii TaxID=2649997 RepID=A0AAD5DPT9_9CHLO|nr:hypothetical protein COHA_006192 [Chlorella ohadii]